ncbi:hypothetical protein ACFRQM_41550 [Streptomyces sp. NPDC056831]|uniref:hypothetical protein n=1 Tax=Streptomyces sp. NPDC056831 TaxID=3345954 RepID=UPI00367BB733
MLGAVTEVFDRAVDVLVVALGLGCVWLGWRAVFRPRRPPEPIQGPVWVVRAWGLGFVLLGISLVVQTMTLMAGGEPGWPANVMRWVAGPLVVGSIVAACAARWRERRRTRAVNERRW